MLFLAWLDLAEFGGLEHQLVGFALLEAAFAAAVGEGKGTFGAAIAQHTFKASSLARLAKPNPAMKCWMHCCSAPGLGAPTLSTRQFTRFL